MAGVINFFVALATSHMYFKFMLIEFKLDPGVLCSRKYLDWLYTMFWPMLYVIYAAKSTWLVSMCLQEHLLQYNILLHYYYSCLAQKEYYVFFVGLFF